MPFVQQKAEQSTSSVSSFTTTAMTVTGGNAIVACMSSNGGTLTSLNASDSKANSYTNGVSTLFNTNGNVAIGVARAIASGSTTFTVTPNAARFVSISAQEYSNLGAANEATNSGSATASTAVNPGAVNPASANDLYVACWTHDGSVNQTFTFNVSGEGWNPRADLENTTNQPLGSQDLISSGSRTGSATLSASAHWEAAVATFQTVAATAAVAPLTQPLLMTLGQRGMKAKPWARPSFLPSPPPYVPPVPPTITPLLARFQQRFGRQPMGRVLPKDSAAKPAYTLSADQGTYILTGQAAPLLATRLVNAAAGAYTLTGAAATLLAARLLKANPGAYTLSGAAATLQATRVMNAAAGSYALSGRAAATLKGYAVGATPGVYSLTGIDAQLLYSATPTAYVLSADAGAYGLSGSASTLDYTQGSSVDGGRLIVTSRKRKPQRQRPPVYRHPEEVERERRMLEEYLESLETKARPASEEPVRPGESQEAPTRRAEPVAPRLSDVMARLASAQQLALIASAERVAKEDRAKAQKEHKRRRTAAIAVLMMSH